jgi:methyl-accepting chemotaxis protein
VVGAAFKEFFHALGDEIGTVVTYLGDFFETWNVSIDDFQEIADNIREIEMNAKAEIEKIKTFQFDPKFKSRVINVPIAIEQIHDFVDLLKTFLFDQVHNVIDPIHDLIQTFKAEAETLSQTMDKPNGLARASSFLHSVETAIGEIKDATDAAKDFTEMATEITDRIEGLNDLFLQQGNPRISAKKAGTKTARVGRLHKD